MGEIAEMMLSGILCCQCGASLYDDVMEQKLDIPIICKDCYDNLSKEEKENYKDRVETVFHKKNN